MLSYQWQDRTFAIDSLNARRPVEASDELVVIACPDPPGADDCLRTVRQVRGLGARGRRGRAAAAEGSGALCEAGPAAAL
jgi:hypothetical protein